MLEQASSVKSDINQGFQMSENSQFSKETAVLRKVKRRRTPDYRRINVYAKSPKQYQKERQRRRQILELLSENKSSTIQIAQELGVCTRTVRRDLDKLDRYLKGQITKRKHLLDEQERQILDILSTYDKLERFKVLTRFLFITRKLSKKEEYGLHNRTIILDLDQAANGVPKVFMEDEQSTIKTPLYVNLSIIKDGHSHVLGGLTIK